MEINLQKKYVDKYKKKSIPHWVGPIELIFNDKFMECSTPEEMYDLRKKYVDYLELLIEENLLKLIDEE